MVYNDDIDPKAVTSADDLTVGLANQSVGGSFFQIFFKSRKWLFLGDNFIHFESVSVSTACAECTCRDAVCWIS